MTGHDKPYINDDFLLSTDAAKELYHSHAEKMPIIDYHCHLPVREIAEETGYVVKPESVEAYGIYSAMLG